MGRSVIIVGGGISGLAAGREILRRGGEPLVLEASERVGGYIRSETVDGALIESGPQGFLGERPGVLDSVEDLGLSETLLPASDIARTRYILHGGQLVALPMSPPALVKSPLLSWKAKLRLVGELFAKGPPPGPESIHDFAARRIGREAASVLVDAAVTGIFAGDPSALSVDACFPKMRAMERDYGGLFRAMKAKRKEGASPMGKRLHSFVGGMEELVWAHERKLGERIRRNAPVTRVERDGAGWVTVLESGERLASPAVVVATPAELAAKQLNEIAPGIAGLLGEIRSAPVAVLGVVYERAKIAHPLDGYGFLVPGGRFPVLGCLFESTVFPGRAPEGKVLLRILVGGARNPEAARQPPEAIVESALHAIRPILGVEGEPEITRCIAHRNAIPQYDLGHLDRLSKLDRERDKLPGLHLAGAAYHGVAVNYLVAEGARIAGEALANGA
jgi:oxygen-dependent protoporphyrinogen oxidase